MQVPIVIWLPKKIAIFNVLIHNTFSFNSFRKKEKPVKYDTQPGDSCHYIVLNLVKKIGYMAKDKRVISKPSGKHILGPDFCFSSYRPQILAICLSFNFAELCKVGQHWY